MRPFEIKKYGNDVVVAIYNNELNPQEIIGTVQNYYPSQKVFAVIKGGKED